MSSKKKSAKPQSRTAARRSRQSASAGTATKPSQDPRSSATQTAATSTTGKGKSARGKAGTSKAAAATKRAAFIEHYLGNGQNATEAAKAAGFAPRSAHVTGCRLLKDANVAQAIAERTQKALEIHGLHTNAVLLELARIVHFDPRKLYKPDGTMKAVHELDDDTAAAIASVEFDEKGQATKVRGWDKNTALGNAMRYLGLMKPEVPLVPPTQQAQTIVHAQQVVMMGPMEAYQRMLTRSAAPAIGVKQPGAD